MSIIDTVGEREEFASSPLVPESFYPTQLTVEGVDVNDNGTPYVSLVARVLEGPFKGSEITSRFHWLSFGKPASKGGGIPLLLNACRVCSGSAANEAVLDEFGFTEPVLTGDEKEDGFTVREALKDFYNDLDHAARLNMITRFLRVAEWDGKKAIISVDCAPSNNNPERFYNNIKGFYPLNHAKRGMAYLKTTAFVDQQLLKDEAASESATA